MFGCLATLAHGLRVFVETLVDAGVILPRSAV
jgi:hypothetical protein